MHSWKTVFWLFGVNFYISMFTFGGGYIVIPMIRKIFVQQKQLFTEAELLEMAAIAQSSPGAIAVNLSVLAGRRTFGIAGAWISAFGAVLPSFLILALISSCYDKRKHGQTEITRRKRRKRDDNSADEGLSDNCGTGRHYPRGQGAVYESAGGIACRRGTGGTAGLYAAGSDWAALYSERARNAAVS